MQQLLKELCSLCGVSGREDAVRDFILEQIKDHCTYTVDPLGNILAHKKGKQPAQKQVLLDAHMDEVGLIVTHVDDEGFLRFDTVGGIDASVLLATRVNVGSAAGVISCKPVHLTEADERKKYPDVHEMYIDIGATTRAEAEAVVNVGDVATFETVPQPLGDLLLAKGIDDRAGCAVLIQLLQAEAEYDFDVSFTVQEEVGLRGARTAGFAKAPDFALVIDATTAADIAGVSPEKTVCKVGGGAVVSFMDKATLYDQPMYRAAMDLAKEKGIAAQPKSYVAGGNNAGAISVSGKGVRTLAVSVPCRYIHSPACVASVEDILAVRDLVKELTAFLAGGALV